MNFVRGTAFMYRAGPARLLMHTTTYGRTFGEWGRSGWAGVAGGGFVAEIWFTCSAAGLRLDEISCVTVDAGNTLAL
jgi:hypothetical protein